MYSNAPFYSAEDDVFPTDSRQVPEGAEGTPLYEQPATTLFIIILFFVIAFVFCGTIVLMFTLWEMDDDPTGNATSPAAAARPATARTPGSTHKSPTKAADTSEDYEDSSTTEEPTETSSGPEGYTGVTRRITTYCRTEDCLKVAGYYKASFGGRGHPCRNAYYYACGTGSINALSDTINAMTGGITRVFKALSFTASGQTAPQKAVAYYRTCWGRDLQQNENIGVLESFLREVGLTFQEDNQTDPLDTTLKLVLHHDTNVFFRFLLTRTAVVNGKFVVNIRQAPQFASWKETQSQVAPTLSKYVDYLKDILAKFGITEDQKVREIAQRIQSAELTIFKVRDENDNWDTGNTFIPMKDIVEVAALKPRWVSSLAAHSDKDLPQDYLVASPVFIRKFINSAFSRVTPSDLNIYVTFEVVRQLLAVSDLMKSRGPPDFLRDRCYSETTRVLMHAVASPYLMSIVNASKMNGAIAMIMSIRDKIENNMRNSPWLENPTKASLLKKLRAVRFQVGFPKGLRTPQEVETYYSHYPDISGPFLKAYLDVSSGRTVSFRKLLATRPADILLLNFNYVAVGAYYESPENVIVIPAGSLLSPLYNYGAPPEVNYGHLGKTIAHEIMHAFDESRRALDEDGKAIAWTTASDEGYQERRECLDESIKNTPISKRTKEDEYLADNLASRSLYEAYKEAELESTTAIPGLERFSPDQIFFLARCILFCSTSKQVNYTTHPGNPHRCNVPLANSPEYAAAFSCPVGSPQNPAHKCGFW